MARDERPAALLRDRLERLRDIAEALLGGLTVESLVTTLIERGLSLFGAFGGALWVLDEDSGTLALRGLIGYPDEVEQRWQDLPLPAAAPAAEAARTGERVVLRSIAERDEHYPALAGRASVGDAFVATPLIVDGRTVGVLGLGFATADVLHADGLVFLDAAVAQCAAALHRALTVEAREHDLAVTKESARRLAALQRLTAALADARAGATTVEFMLDEVADAVGAQAAALCVLDTHAGMMRTVKSRGLSEQMQAEFATFPYVAGLPATDALILRKPVLLHDTAERDRLYPDLATRYPEAQAWACLPLVMANRPIGALAVSMPAPHAFAPDDVEFLLALADQCAHALERVRLLELEAANRRRLELFAEAGRVFAAPLDVRLTSVQFTRLVVGHVADAASVHLREADGRYSLAAAEHHDAGQADAQRILSTNLPPAVIDAYDAVLASGRPLLSTEISTDALDAAVDADKLASLDLRAPQSNILAPLIAGGRPLGVVSVTTVVDGRPPLTISDLEWLVELVGRLALAINSARLLHQRTEIAYTLQRSLLPASLPLVPGAEVAVQYLAGAEGVDVGGDFYDVIPLPNGRVGLVVGDVMGRGIRAAAVMGQLRAAVRAYSLEGHSPAALLTRLDRLLGTLDEGMLVTALYAEWDPVRATVLCSCAGHLPPLIRMPGKPASYLDLDPGVPLGVGVQTYVEVDVTLPPGSLLLAYTDGLVEGPELPVEEGMDRLLAAVASSPTAAAACDAALAELRPANGSGRYDDDTALLALLTHPVGVEAPRTPSPDGEVRVDLPADNGSPGRARSLVAGILDEWGLDDLEESATLLVSELVTNAVRHAGTALQVSMSRPALRRVRVGVTDRAPGVDVGVGEAALESEGGRGLFLVEHLSAGWGSIIDEAGKTVWFELQA